MYIWFRTVAEYSKELESRKDIEKACTSRQGLKDWGIDIKNLKQNKQAVE